MKNFKLLFGSLLTLCILFGFYSCEKDTTNANNNEAETALRKAPPPPPPNDFDCNAIITDACVFQDIPCGITIKIDNVIHPGDWYGELRRINNNPKFDPYFCQCFNEETAYDVDIDGNTTYLFGMLFYYPNVNSSAEITIYDAAGGLLVPTTTVTATSPYINIYLPGLCG